MIHRVEGHRPWLMLPPRFRTTAAVAAFGPPALAVALTVATAAVVPLPVLLPLFLSSLFVPRLVMGRLKQAASRLPLTESPRDLPAGATVRVRGRVAHGPTFATAARKRPAVLAAYIGTVERVRGRLSDGAAEAWWETRGIDFAIELDSGERVKVSARSAYLVQLGGVFEDALALRNRFEPAIRARFSLQLERGGVATYTVGDEAAVSPGDEVEIVGVLDQELDPSAPRLPRQSPLTPVIRGTMWTPVLVVPERRTDERMP